MTLSLGPAAIFAGDALQDQVVALVGRGWSYARIARLIRVNRRLVWDLWLQHCAERRASSVQFRPYRFAYQQVAP